MRFPSPTPEYQGLRQLKETWAPVYGPFQSRRYGQSLGINILGDRDKICSYDCVYCELGETLIRMNEIRKEHEFEKPDVLDAKIRDGFKKIKEKNISVDRIMIVGNGEPTLHPNLDEIIPNLLKARDEMLDKVPVGILTNGTGAESRRLVRELNTLDSCDMKFDCGNDRLLKAVNAPLVRVSTTRLIQIAQDLENLTVQSLFVQGAVDNTLHQDIEEWSEVVGMLKPKEVHLYTLERIPAKSGLKKVDEDTLHVIAAKLERWTKIKAKVFYS